MSSAQPTKQQSTTFRDAFDKMTSKDQGKKRLGENRMPEYTDYGLGSQILVVSQMVRGGNPAPTVREIVSLGTTQDIVDIIILVFVTRNTRGGKGEKQLAHDIYLPLWYNYPETASQLMKLFSHYGYWKDLLLLMVEVKSNALYKGIAQRVIQTAMELMKDQLTKDIVTMKQYKKTLDAMAAEEDIELFMRRGPKISLLSKWMPREGTSFDKKIGKFVDQFVALMWPESCRTSINTMSTDQWQSAAKARYRKIITTHTSFLALPEVLLAAKREEEIEFDRVASKATFRLRKTFLNENKRGGVRSMHPKRLRLAERFQEHVTKKGLKGGQVMPHEIVSMILKKKRISVGEEQVLDAQWKDIWRIVLEQVMAKAAEDGLAFNPTRMIPMADVSGSMTGIPMEVSIALSIGVSEITHDAFKNRVLTFSEQPVWHMLNPKNSIVAKVRSLQNAPWGMNTNFEAAYDLILSVVEEHKIRREDMPVLIVFSDMQFDEARGRTGAGAWATMQNHIRTKFAGVGRKLRWVDTTPPPIVYWNIRNVGGHPVDKDTEGTVLLSGFSPALIKLVMHGEALQEEEFMLVEADGSVVATEVQITPEQILHKMLDDKLYDPVREILHASREGKLLEYEALIPVEAPGQEDYCTGMRIP